MKTCHKVSDVLIGVVGNVLHHFIGYEKLKPSTGVFAALALPLDPSAPLNMFWFAALPLTPFSFFICYSRVNFLSALVYGIFSNLVRPKKLLFWPCRTNNKRR